MQSQFINTPKGDQDAVIAKINASGNGVVWATYLGGNGWDSDENSVRMGPSGDPYFLFTTESSGIATPGAYDPTYGGNQDFLISRIDTESGEVIWSTYMGGSDNESTETHELGVDHFGNAYVSGPTKSMDYPVTNGVFQSVFEGPVGFNDIVVSKISPDGAQLIASTYLGGNGADRSEGIGIDEQQRVFITGTTTSSNFPLTGDAYQKNINGLRDAFAVVLEPDFSSLAYSTYIGSSGTDYGRSAEVDSKGNFLLAGEANVSGWPLVGQAESFSGGSGDGVIARFTSCVTTNVYPVGQGSWINIYPNPAANELFIDFDQFQETVNISIYNNLGQNQFTDEYVDIKVTDINLRQMLPGIYYLVVQPSKEVPVYVKFLKQ